MNFVSEKTISPTKLKEGEGVAGRAKRVVYRNPTLPSAVSLLERCLAE